MVKKSMNFSTSMLTVMLILALSSTSPVLGDIDYNSCLSQIIPCGSYLMDGSPNPGAECCTAAQALDRVAMSSLSDKTEFCLCIKKIALTPPFDPERAYQLPILCNLKTPITRNINC